MSIHSIGRTVVSSFLILGALFPPVRAQWVPTANPCVGETVFAFAAIGTKTYAGARLFGVCRSLDGGANWTAIGKGDLAKASVSSLATVPDSNGGTALFAGTFAAGVFLSRDEGETWQAVNGDVKTGKTIPSRICDLATIGKSVFAAGCDEDKGVYRSDDLGQTWSAPAKDIYKRYNGEYGVSVYSLTSIGRVLVAGTLYGTAHSEDGGVTWESETSSLPYDKSSYTGEVRPMSVQSVLAVDKVVYAAVGDSGVYKSLDSGRSWQKPRNGLRGVVNGFGRSGGSVLAGAGGNYSSFSRLSDTYRGGLYISSDEGETWKEADSGLKADQVHSVFAGSNGLLAGTDAGMYASRDGGVTWRWISRGIAPRAAPSHFAISGKTFFAEYLDTVYRSDDGADSWRLLESGLPAKPLITSLCTNGADFFVGGSAGLFAWAENAGAWIPAGNGMPAGTPIQALACGPGRLVAGTYRHGVYVSGNGGGSWLPFDSGLPDSASIAGLGLSGDRIFAGVSEGTLYKTSVDGGHWEKTGFPMPQNRPITSIVVTDSSLLAGIRYDGNHGVFKSDDDGLTWDPMNSGLFKSFDSYSVNTMLAVGSDVLIDNSDFGPYVLRKKSPAWEDVSQGLPPFTGLLDLERSGDTVYASVGWNGLWKRALSQMDIVAPPPTVKLREMPKARGAAPWILSNGRIRFPGESPDPSAILELHTLEGRNLFLKCAPGGNELGFACANLRPGVYGYTLISGRVRRNGRFVNMESFRER